MGKTFNGDINLTIKKLQINNKGNKNIILTVIKQGVLCIFR